MDDYKLKIPQKVSELVAVRDRLLATGDAVAARQAANIDFLLLEIDEGRMEPAPEA